MDGSMNKIMAGLMFNITGALTQFELLEKAALESSMRIQQTMAKTSLTMGAGGAVGQMTAQQAMAQTILKEGEARKAAIVAEGEAKISAIQAKEALTRQGIAQKEAQTMLAITREQVAQQQLLYMQSRTAAFTAHTGMLSLIGRHISWMATGAAIFGTLSLLKDGLVDVETGMKGLITVLPELHADQEAYNEASREAIDIMQKYGSSLDDTMTSARSFGRMYKEIDTVMGLVNNATLLNVIDQVKLEDAVKGNEVALSTYGEALKSTNEVLAFSGKLMDSITNLSHNTLATGTDLVSILQQTSSAAKQAGTDLDQLLGVGATAIGKTGLQGQGGNIGRALRTVFTQLSVPSESVEKEINDIGVSLRNLDTGELRSAYDIILDLSLATSDAKLNQEELNEAMLKASSGKFQYNKLAALLGHFDDIVKNTALSINSQGQTMEMAAQQMDTISRKAGMLKATLIDMFSGADDSGLRDELKGLIDGLNQFIMGLNNLDTHVLTTGMQVLQIVVAWKALGAVYNFILPLTAALTLMSDGLTFAQARQVVATSGATAALTMERTALVATTVATTGAAVATESLNLALIKNPLGLVVTALSALAGVALYQYINKLGEAEMAQTKLNQAQEDEVTIASQKASQANSTINYLNTLKEKHSELSKAINSGKLASGELEAAQKNLQAVDEAVLILTDSKMREQIKANGVTEAEIDLVIQSQVTSKEAALSKITDQKKLTDITIENTLSRIAALEKENALWLEMSANASVDSNSFLNVGGGNAGGGFLGAIEAENNKLKAEEKKRTSLVQSIITATGEIEGLKRDPDKPPDTGGNTGGGSASASSYAEPFKQYVDALSNSLPVVDDLLSEHNTALDIIGIKQGIWKNAVGDSIPTLTQEQEAFASLTGQMVQHRDIQDDLHTTADKYRAGLASVNQEIDKENARYASGNVSAKDHQEALGLLLDEKQKLEKQVEQNGTSWMKEEESISNLNASVKSQTEITREYRDTMIDSYKNEIDYLTRDGASQEELSRAYEKQGSYILLLMQKRTDLDAQVVDGEKKLSDLQKAQESLNTSTEQGALQYDFYGQAIAEVSGKLADLKSEQIAANKSIEEANDLIAKDKIAELDEKYSNHMMTLDQYVDSLQDVEDQYKGVISVEEQFALNLEQSGLILEQWTRDINAALDEAEKSFDDAMDAIEDSITAAEDSLSDFSDAVDAIFDAVDDSGSSSLLSDEILKGINASLPNMMDMVGAVGAGTEQEWIDAVTAYINPSKSTTDLTGVLAGVSTAMTPILSGAVSAATENATTTKAVDYSNVPGNVHDAVGSKAFDKYYSDFWDLINKKAAGTITDDESTVLKDIVSKSSTVSDWYNGTTTEYTTSKAEFLANMESSVNSLADAGTQIDTALSDVSAWQLSEDTRIDNEIADKQQSLKDNLALLEDLFADIDAAEKKYARETAKNNFDKSYAAAMGIETAPGVTPTTSDLQTLAAGLPGQIDLTKLAGLNAADFKAAITQGLTTLEDAKITAEGYISDLAASTQSQIDAIDAQLKALDEEETADTRADAEEAHNKRILKLQQQIKEEEWHIGQEHVENVIDLNKQIEEENASWAETQEDYAREDKKTELQTQKEKLQTQSELLTTALNDFVTYINSEISTRKEATSDYKTSLQDQTNAEVAALETEKSLVDKKAALLTTMLEDLDKYVTGAIAKWQKLADDRVDIETKATDKIIANATKEKEATTATWNANKSAIQSVMQDSTLAQLAMMAAINNKGSEAVESIIAMISDSGYKKDITAAIKNIATLATPTPADDTDDDEEDEADDDSGGSASSGTTGGTGTGSKTPYKTIDTNNSYLKTNMKLDGNAWYGNKWFWNAIGYPDTSIDADGNLTVSGYKASGAWMGIRDYFEHYGRTVDSPTADGKINVYAKGTNYAKGGLSLVGEYGPELLNIPEGSQVTPSLQTKDFFNTAKVSPDFTTIRKLLANIDMLQAKISVAVNNNFDKATDRIVAAIESKMKLVIGNAVNIEHYEPQDNTDVNILTREVMRQIGQL